MMLTKFREGQRFKQNFCFKKKKKKKNPEIVHVLYTCNLHTYTYIHVMFNIVICRR